MFTALNTFGFGLSFCSRIKNLYASPTNKVVSTYSTEVEDIVHTSFGCSYWGLCRSSEEWSRRKSRGGQKNHPNPVSEKCWHYTLLQIREMFFRFRFSISCCDNTVFEVWLGLGTESTWSGLQKAFHLCTPEQSPHLLPSVSSPAALKARLSLHLCWCILSHSLQPATSSPLCLKLLELYAPPATPLRASVYSIFNPLGKPLLIQLVGWRNGFSIARFVVKTCKDHVWILTHLWILLQSLVSEQVSAEGSKNPSSSPADINAISSVWNDPTLRGINCVVFIFGSMFSVDVCFLSLSNSFFFPSVLM